MFLRRAPTLLQVGPSVCIPVTPQKRSLFLQQMIRSIIELSQRFRFMVVAIAVLIMAIGISQLDDIPVDVLPEFSLPYVEIQTESLGLSAEEVEQLITVPMEQDLLNGIPWLKTIRSESVPGLSSIVLVFEPGTDLMRARQMVSERMTQAVALPHVSKPPTMLQPLSATSRVLIVGLSSKSLSPIQMSVLARWTIAPRLMGVPGVANVAIWGQRDRQLQVQVDPKRLRDAGISLLSVLETTGNALWVSSLSFVEASTPGTGGFIDTQNQRLGIRHILPIVSSEGLAQVPIEGSTKRLGDVARVVEDHQPLIGDALTKDGPGLLLVVEKFPGANTLEVTREVEEALAELLPGLPGMEVDSNIFRPADFIEAAIHNLGIALLIGFILIAVILAAFFFAWRSVLIGLVAIPLSLAAAAFVLTLTGATINTIALTGLLCAVGVVVCYAIIDLDNIVQRLRQERTEGNTNSTARVILEASLESRSTMFYTTLILLLAVSPILFIEGSSGAFFRPMAVSYGLAILASLLVALTVVPALSLIILPNGWVERRASPFAGWLQRLYEPVLARVIRRGRLVSYIAVGVLTVAGAVILSSLSWSLLPSFKERNLLIDIRCLPGTSQPDMSRISGRIKDELGLIPGVRKVGAHIGRAVRGDQVVNVNSAELWVSIDPSANYDKTAAAIGEVVDGYPGLYHAVKTYLTEKSNDVAAEPDDDIVIRVYGDADEVLRTQAENVRKALSGIDGIADSHIKIPLQQPTLETEVDLKAARRYGLKPGDVRRAAATLLSGIQVGSLFEEQKVFDVVVWSTPETRRSLTSIGDLLIDTPGGGQVRLADVAHLRIVPTPSVIRHDAVKRYIDVIASVDGRDRGAVAMDIESRIRKIPFALEYHARVLGEHEASRAVNSQLLVFEISSAIGMFFLLQAAFASWRLAALCFLTLPSALVGGLLTVVATGQGMSLGSLAGLLTVFGIATCNAVMLINRYQSLQRYGGESIGAELVLRGARERLSPILMTTLATGGALAPVLLMGDVPGLEIVRPMAMVTLGGLVTSSLLNLFFVPALFLSVESLPHRVDPPAAAEAARDGMFGGLAEAPAVGNGMHSPRSSPPAGDVL
jgi:CzcA family heavy metal efflux pump